MRQQRQLYVLLLPIFKETLVDYKNEYALVVLIRFDTKEDANVQKYIQGQALKKEIYVPGKLVSLVV